MGLNWARAQRQRKMRERGTLAATTGSKTEQNVYKRTKKYDHGEAMSKADVARLRELRAKYLDKHGK